MKGVSTEAEKVEQMKHSVKSSVADVSFEIVRVKTGSDCNRVEKSTRCFAGPKLVTLCTAVFDLDALTCTIFQENPRKRVVYSQLPLNFPNS
jgi:hypothetical protein